MSELSPKPESAADPLKLVEMAKAFSRSRVLCAAARLGIADALDAGPKTVDQLASACQADPAALHRLLRAMASIGLVAEKSPGMFALTPMGEPLRKDAPNSAWAGIIFWADLLADSWNYLTDCIRTGTTAGQVMKTLGVESRWSKDPNAGSIFRRVMGTAPAERYQPIVASWDFSKARVVADLGGGGGALIVAVLNANPHLTGMLVDNQAAVEAAAGRLQREGLLTGCFNTREGEAPAEPCAADLKQPLSRCQAVPADLRESVPAGADVYLLKHVLHGYTDDGAVTILKNCRSVIPPEGRLLVIEFVLPDLVDHSDPDLEHRLMSDLNMLAVTGGKERSRSEWKSLLEQSGFELQQIIPVSGDPVSIIEAAPIR